MGVAPSRGQTGTGQGAGRGPRLLPEPLGTQALTRRQKGPGSSLTWGPAGAAGPPGVCGTRVTGTRSDQLSSHLPPAPAGRSGKEGARP